MNEKFTFLLSDESPNANGYIIKTGGIDTKRFEKNPVMFYQHETTTVIGRWENIRKTGGALYADAVFDDTTEIGRQVKEQVEKGFLRAASIGVDSIKEHDENGVTILEECELIEVSIVELPANKNAVKLFRYNNRKMLLLNIAENTAKELRETLISLLGLGKTATDEDIINIVTLLIHKPDDEALNVDEAIKDGYINEADRGDFLTIARANKNAFARFIEREKEKRLNSVKTAIEKGRLNSCIVAETLQEIGVKMGVEVVNALITAFSRPPRIMEIIDGGDRSKWTLSDYRKYRPNDLKENPKLYAALLEKEQQQMQAITPKNLDYYRKHNPDFLREHPDFYEKLIKNN